jgi:hypothetical protein
MSEESDDLKDKLNKFKPKKKTLTVPTEFLENANSYDDKLIVVKVFAEKNVKNTVRLFKNMLKGDIEKKKRR